MVELLTNYRRIIEMNLIEGILVEFKNHPKLIKFPLFEFIRQFESSNCFKHSCDMKKWKYNLEKIKEK